MARAIAPQIGHSMFPPGRNVPSHFGAYVTGPFEFVIFSIGFGNSGRALIQVKALNRFAVRVAQCVVASVLCHSRSRHEEQRSQSAVGNEPTNTQRTIMKKIAVAIAALALAAAPAAFAKDKMQKESEKSKSTTGMSSGSSNTPSAAKAPNAAQPGGLAGSGGGNAGNQGGAAPGASSGGGAGGSGSK